MKTFFTNLLLCSLVAFLTGASSPKSDRSCDCSPFVFKVSTADQKIIYEIVSTVGNTPAPLLLFKKNHLESLGKKIGNVPPLQFFAFVFSTPQLTQDMVKIRSSSTKYKAFISGFKPSLSEEFEKGCLIRESEGFANYLSLNPIEVKAVIEASLSRCKGTTKDPCFRPFFDYLIDHKK